MRQRAAHHRRTPWDVFVSHVGEDHEFAGEVETRIKEELGKTAREVNVFNTSDLESRFYRFFGPDQRHLLPEYERELKEYIEHNMSMSRVYLLLVSRRSMEKNSKWVSYEISIAREFAAGRPWFFIPCVFDGVKLSELPVEAANFHGIDISSEMGFGELFRHLREALKEPV